MDFPRAARTTGAPRFLRRAPVVVFSTLALFALGQAPPAWPITLAPRTIEETIQDSEAIFVGRLSSSESRWRDGSKRLIVTDHVFHIEKAVLSAKGAAEGHDIRLTVLGGKIGDESQGIAGMPELAIDKRYVIFLRPKWAEGTMPFTGGTHGLFRVVEKDKVSHVVDADGAPLFRSDTGRILRPEEARERKNAESGVALDAFLEMLRKEAPRLKALPPRSARPQADRNDPRILAIFAKREAPEEAEAPRNPPARALKYAPPAEAVPAPPSTPIFRGGESVAVDSESARALDTAAEPSPHYAFDGSWNLPIVVNNFPSSMAPWSPEDQYQMAKWNHHRAEVFRVYTTPTDTWRWGNGVNDLAGFPDSATMKRQFGSTWEELGFIGVTYTKKNGDRIVEADLALNPAYSWTLDDEWVYNGGAAQSFRETMTHELGHMWGLRHQFSFLSVMNYSPAVYRAFAFPFADDAEGIRTRYPGSARVGTDMAIYLFYSAGTKDWRSATFPSTTNVGSSFTVNNYHLENVGTNAVSAPAVEWYLTPSRNFTGTIHYLGTTTYSRLDRFRYLVPSSVSRTLTVPRTVPAGSYYLAAFIRGDESAGMSGFPVNNSRSFSRTKIQVRP